MLKVRTLFSGIGSPEQALKMIGCPYELVDFCEFDKYAVKSYCAIHGVSEDKNLGDISLVDETKLPYADIQIWGFPCQSISVAGLGAGIIKGVTTSGLYYEGLRILKATMPKYSVIENVKNLVGKKFIGEFEQMLKDLSEMGYNNYWKVLNAKHFGVAQNRERVFIVSIRKDVDDGTFEFPVGYDNGLRLKDFLDDDVDEKFYLSEEYVERFKKSLLDKEMQKKIPHDGVYTVLGTTVNPEAKGTNSRHWVYDTDKLSSCLAATDYKQPKQIIEQSKNEIVTMEVPQMVKIRIHEVDTEKLKVVLKSHKCFTNKVISETLGQPLTLVEHWFRQDNYFSIPEADIWLELKLLLRIETNEFDESIMEFEEREGKFEKANRVYHEEGIAPTLTSSSADEKVYTNKINVLGNMSNTGHHGLDVYSQEGISPTLKARDYKDPVRIMTEATPIRLGGIFDTDKKHQAGAIWDIDGVAPTLDTMQGGYRQPSVLLEPRIRVEGNIYGDKNPQAGRVYNSDYLSPSLNSSIKNNGQPLVIETPGFVAKKYDEFIDENGYVPEMFNPYNKAEIKGAAPILSTYCGSTTSSATVLKYDGYRIRKLTPKECFALMGFDSESFKRAEKVNSNSQLYKQAGNSIVTNVLAHLFRNLLKNEYQVR